MKTSHLENEERAADALVWSKLSHHLAWTNVHQPHIFGKGGHELLLFFEGKRSDDAEG